MDINNTQFAVLDASEDFMVTALVLVSGLITDRIGGASMSSLHLFCIADNQQKRSFMEMASTRSAPFSWPQRRLFDLIDS